MYEDSVVFYFQIYIDNKTSEMPKIIKHVEVFKFTQAWYSQSSHY